MPVCFVALFYFTPSRGAAEQALGAFGFACTTKALVNAIRSTAQRCYFFRFLYCIRAKKIGKLDICLAAITYFFVIAVMRDSQPGAI